MPAQHDATLAALIIESALGYAIFTMDLKGEISSWSRGSEQIVGYSRREAIGMSFGELFTTPDRQSSKGPCCMGAEAMRWHLRKDSSRLWGNGMTMGIFGPKLTGLMKILRDETPARLAEDQRILLLNELNHRIKNTLVTVQSIAEQTLRAAQVDPKARRELTDRLMAMSDAHDVLVDESRADKDLGTIVCQALVQHDHPAHSQLGARQVNLLWRERRGPAVSPPRNEGFGSRLIARTFRQDSDGQARIDNLLQGVQRGMQHLLSGADEEPAQWSSLVAGQAGVPLGEVLTQAGAQRSSGPENVEG